MLYHGTDRKNAKNIIEKGFNTTVPAIQEILYQSDNKGRRIKIPGSLGYGVYTFQDSYSMAKSFSKKFSKDVCVLKIEISDEANNNILDLTKDRVKEEFSHFARIAESVKNADQLYSVFKKYGSAKMDLYAGIMTELYILFLTTKKKRKIRCVRKRTETLLPPLCRVHQRLCIDNGTEFTIRYPREDIKSISEEKR
ncbi:MAG: hypothetical protein K2P14_07115 [Anaeroplasmataceae bacterium]|nr:hypothetical protein [Anaeroplasmataceae bacterium]